MLNFKTLHHIWLTKLSLSGYISLSLDRLEKIRRGAYGLADENSDNSATNNDAVGGNSDIQYQHDSAESSVEGKLMR